MALKPLKPPRFKPFKPAFGSFKPTLGKWGGTYVKPKPFRAPPNIAGQVRGPTPPNISGQVRGTTAGTYNQGASVEQRTPLTDYGSLISGDWEVQDAEAAMGAQMAKARGDFQAQLRQQLIDLGLSDTSKLGSLGQYIDEDTIKAAVANKYSVTAQNSQAAERARAQNNAALAARGILSSGQTTKSQTDVSAGQESANYAGLRSFLEGGAQGLSGLSDLEYNLSRNIAAARAAAAQRAGEFGPGGDPTGYDQYGLSTDYSATRDTSAAVAAAQRAMANQGLNSQLAAQRRAMLSRRAWTAKHPQGVYANYARAYRRMYG